MRQQAAIASGEAGAGSSEREVSVNRNRTTAQSANRVCRGNRSAVAAFAAAILLGQIGVYALEGRAWLLTAAWAIAHATMDIVLVYARTSMRPIHYVGFQIARAVLAFARALGEFGATVVLAGNIEGRTRTIPLAVYALLESPGGARGEWVLAGASVVLALLALAGYEVLSRWQRARLEERSR